MTSNETFVRQCKINLCRKKITNNRDFNTSLLSYKKDLQTRFPGTKFDENPEYINYIKCKRDIYPNEIECRRLLPIEGATTEPVRSTAAFFTEARQAAAEKAREAAEKARQTASEKARQADAEKARQAASEKARQAAEKARQEKSHLITRATLDCLAKYFPSLREQRLNGNIHNQGFIEYICAAAPSYDTFLINTKYTSWLNIYDSLSIENMDIIDKKNIGVGLDMWGPSKQVKGLLVQDAIAKFARSLNDLGHSNIPSWINENIMRESGLMNPTYGFYPQGINLYPLFANIQGIIECFIILFHTLRPEVDPDILHKLQLIKDKQDAYIREKSESNKVKIGGKIRRTKRTRKSKKSRKSKNSRKSKKSRKYRKR